MIKGLSVFGRAKRADIKARVYRASTGKWENLGVIASSRLPVRFILWLKRLWKAI